MNGTKQEAQMGQKVKPTAMRAFADTAKWTATYRILLNPKIWIAVFDVVGLILFKQFKVDLEPEVFWSIQALVLVLIAAVSGD
jgi:hypothetical protein